MGSSKLTLFSLRCASYLGPAAHLSYGSCQWNLPPQDPPRIDKQKGSGIVGRHRDAQPIRRVLPQAIGISPSLPPPPQHPCRRGAFLSHNAYIVYVRVCELCSHSRDVNCIMWRQSSTVICSEYERRHRHWAHSWQNCARHLDMKATLVCHGLFLLGVVFAFLFVTETCG